MMRTYWVRFPRLAIALACSGLLVLIGSGAWAQATGDYRSAASGNWNVTATWERFDGTNWVPAAATPTSADGVITVRSPHTVTVTAAVTADQVVVDAGGQITQNAITVTIANGAGNDLSVNGTYRNAGTMTINASATVAFGSGGKYQHNFTTSAGTIPTATWDTASTCEIIGYTSNNNAPGGLGQSFGNFTWNCPSQSANLNLAGGLTTVGGDMAVTATNTGTLRLTGSTAVTLAIAGNFSQTAGTFSFVTTNNNMSVAVNVAGNFSLSGGTFNMSEVNNAPTTLNVTGNFSHTAGTITETGNSSGTIVFNKAGTQTCTSGGAVSNTIHFTVNNGSTLAMGTSVVTGGGNFTLSSGGGLQIGSTGGIAASGATGNIQNTGTRSFSTGANYTYNGAAAQISGTGLPATTNSLTINNAAGVTLTNSSTASASITLTSGNVTTGANTLGLSAGGSVSRTSGHVVGNFSKGFGTGAVTKSFEVGSTGAYTPATISFANVATGGNVTASATGTEHPNAATSGIDPARSVNRYWTLTNGGIVFSTYDATFEFVPGDVDGGADPNAFYVRKFDSPNWTAPVTGARTATSTQTTGLTSFSDFAIGERIVHTITATAGANGSISPSGAVGVPDAESQTFTIAPDACYQVADVLVDGASVGAVGTYTFTGVTANHTIAASFAPITYTVAASAGSGGSISPSGAVSVNCGSDQTFAITPDACYSIADVLVDGVSVGAVGSYTFTNVAANHTIDASFSIDTYTITATAGANGSIAPSGSVTVNCGSDQAFTITPDACYSIADVLVDGISVGAVSSYTFTNVTANHTIDASFSFNNYTITATAGAGGSISPSAAISVSCGSDQTFTIAPDACYSIADVLVDGVSVGAVGSYTFTNVTANHTIDASFSLDTYTITATAGAGGSIAPSGAVSVNCGSDQTFTIAPDVCYSIADVLVDGVSVGAVGSYTFTNVTANHTIDASFSLNSYTITATADAGGSISPSGAVSVNCGSDQTFTIAPDACYSIADVLVDGVSVGAVGSYTFTNVTANHTIDASFSLDTYTITATAGAGGSISPSGAVSVNCGSDQTFTITPDPGYSIADVVVDGSSVGAVSSHTFTNVTANHTIDASFSLNSYTITATAGANGSISPSGAVSVAYGADQTFAITPDACYSIADVLVDGVSVGAVASYTFTNVTADHTIDASFVLTTYTITATAGANGSISPSGAISVSCGADQAFTMTPDAGYHILDVLVDGASVGAVSSYTFANVTASHTIDASFEINPAVPPISALTAMQVKLGNDADGTTKILLGWPAVAAGSTVEVYRAPFGNYPEYDDGGTPGSVPSAPTYPPPSPWTLTAVSDSGQTDEVALRDVYYYVAFVTDGYGTKSPVSNMTGGTLNYHLGDTHNGSTACAGDNVVTTSDVSYLGANYGAALTDGDPRACLDVGPTIDGSVNARPSTDNRLQFEDLILIGINYNSVGKTSERLAPASADEIAVESSVNVPAGETFVARLLVSGTGKAQGVSIRLSWNPSVVEPVGVEAGDLLQRSGGIALSPDPGVVDAVVLGGGDGAGISGSGTLALVTFRVLATGDAKIAVASIDARDSVNEPVPMRTRLAVSTPEDARVDANRVLAATALLPNRPNPFNPRTTVAFHLAEPDAVELSIYSADGRLVRTLARGLLPAGQHDLVWDGRDEHGADVGSGKFFALLKTSKATMTRTLTLIR